MKSPLQADLFGIMRSLALGDLDVVKYLGERGIRIGGRLMQGGQLVRFVSRLAFGSSLVVVAGLVVNVAVFAQTTRPSGQRPNVVIIFPDQLRWSEVGCYGNKVIRTPNIDRLAAEGVRFTHAFTNFPLCSPARSILLSGRYARSTGVLTNQEEALPGRPTNQETTLAEVLTKAGYATALVGKWHLFPTPGALGFGQSLRCRFAHRYYKQTFYKNEGDPYVHEGFSPEHETEAAITFLRENRKRPFFLYLSYGPPHMPISEMPEKYKTMYEPAKIPLRPNVFKDGKLAYDENWFKIYMWDFLYYQHKDTFTEQLPAGMDLRDLIAFYYGQTTSVDDQVGRVLGALKELGLERNTIVVFTSDHGDLLGSHQLFNKGRHYDEASRVPMIVRYPAKLQPRVIKTQVASLVDIMPTVLELCAVKRPESVQGSSLVGVLAGEKSAVGENAAFIETGTHEGIRTPQYLYEVERKPGTGEQLFNLDEDPYQMQDRAGDPKYQKIRNELRARVQAWRTRTPEPQRSE